MLILIIHVCEYCVCMCVSVWKEMGFVHNVFVIIFIDLPITHMTGISVQ